jgi:hypothetical protein
MALIGPAAAGLVFVTVVAIDRIREPHREPATPYAVVDSRTLRRALARVDRLERRGQLEDTLHARTLLQAANLWLGGEIRTGPKRRRVQRASQREQVELRLEQLGSRLGLSIPEIG